ncbi:MAG: methyltransferase [Saprospiraceae bacterium]|nr:methyltransferase [Saprospiraceae bacterium]
MSTYLLAISILSVFHFKQFSIQQDQCAMKIGTDGVLLGTWAALAKSLKILDIGTGTGLLALIAAQRNPSAQIHAIEIEPLAAKQAQENISRSKWKNRIQVYHSSLQTWSTNPLTTYDTIISNPPFFSKKANLLAKGKARQIARSTQTLPPEELLQSVAQLLEPQGHFFVILPVTEAKKFIHLAKDWELYAKEIVHVFPKPNKMANRMLINFTKQLEEVEESSITIRSNQAQPHNYTEQYIEYVRDFYTIY